MNAPPCAPCMMPPRAPLMMPPRVPRMMLPRAPLMLLPRALSPARCGIPHCRRICLNRPAIPPCPFCTARRRFNRGACRSGQALGVERENSL
ncbi:unnamed protein product [Closterium sp. Naga37s-1]|nr:unnamed protein product [Closterium sp. Naga37s-1]